MEKGEREEILSKIKSPSDMMEVLRAYLNEGHDDELEHFINLEMGNRPIYEHTPEAWHPTLQQCLMRALIVPVIKRFALFVNYDERNKATIEMCKKMNTLLYSRVLSSHSCRIREE